MKRKNKKITYVNAHFRENTKRAGKHFVKGHYRGIGHAVSSDYEVEFTDGFCDVCGKDKSEVVTCRGPGYATGICRDCIEDVPNSEEDGSSYPAVDLSDVVEKDDADKEKAEEQYPPVKIENKFNEEDYEDESKLDKAKKFVKMGKESANAASELSIDAAKYTADQVEVYKDATDTTIERERL